MYFRMRERGERTEIEKRREVGLKNFFQVIRIARHEFLD